MQTQSGDYQIEIEQEHDGRFVAEIPQIPGAMAYGVTEDEAIAKVNELAAQITAST